MITITCEINSMHTGMSRGRGRGASAERGSSKPPSTGQDPRTRNPSTVEELREYLYSLNESNVDQFGDRFADMVLQFASNDEKKLKEAFDLIFNATLESKTNADLGGQVCERIIHGPAEEHEERRSIRINFRTALLSRLKDEFNAKDSIRKRSIEAWLAVLAFMCRVYVRVRVGKDPIQIVGKAIVEAMNHNLELPDIMDDEIECICDCLKLCGQHLEEQHSALVAQMVETLRTKCISAKSSCMARCLSLEIIELRAMGWKDQEKQLHKFYRDALPDAIAEDELNRT